jgi:hypothetical protein
MSTTSRRDLLSYSAGVVMVVIRMSAVVYSRLGEGGGARPGRDRDHFTNLSDPIKRGFIHVTHTNSSECRPEQR